MRPFSAIEANLGAAGTFPTHGFMREPPTDNVQDPQSPLRIFMGGGVKKVFDVEAWKVNGDGTHGLASCRASRLFTPVCPHDGPPLPPRVPLLRSPC